MAMGVAILNGAIVFEINFHTLSAGGLSGEFTLSSHLISRFCPCNANENNIKGKRKSITNLMGAIKANPIAFNEAFGYIQECGGVYPHHRGEHAFHLRATDEIWELTDQEAVRMIMLETC